MADEITTLVWGHRTDKPVPESWNIGPSVREQTAGHWRSLRHAINYAVGMKTDRERDGLHPWIRTPQGHVYSPTTIEAMAAAMLDPRERPGAFAAAKGTARAAVAPDRFLRVAQPSE